LTQQAFSILLGRTQPHLEILLKASLYGYSLLVIFIALLASIPPLTMGGVVNSYADIETESPADFGLEPESVSLKTEDDLSIAASLDFRVHPHIRGEYYSLYYQNSLGLKRVLHSPFTPLVRMVELVGSFRVIRG